MKILQAFQQEKLGPWDYFIGIPLCGEWERYQYVLQSIHSLKRSKESDRILLLLLINENPASPALYCQQNQQTLMELLSHSARCLLTSPPSWLISPEPFLDLLVINRTQMWRFPEKQGVGLARKILADIGACLWSAGMLRRKWLHNTDGDAILPDDYLLQAAPYENDPTTTALLYQYQHHNLDDEQAEINDHWQAAQLYECWLRYYELGLAYAASPFAFPTIGSTITIDAEAYQRIHGFPRRSAGEDFYLLNKLAKLGKIQVLGGKPIILADRPSVRVPFGTGQGTAKIQSLLRQQQSYEVYHPAVFDGLKIILKTTKAYLQLGNTEQFQDILLRETEQIHPQLGREPLQKLWLNAVADFQFQNACHTVQKQARDQAGIERQFHVWFDAFRTLKWIHRLRDQFFANLELAKALASARFIPQNYEGRVLEHLRNLQSSARSGGCG